MADYNGKNLNNRLSNQSSQRRQTQGFCDIILIPIKNKNHHQKNIVKPEGLDLVVGRAVAYLGLIGFKVAGRLCDGERQDLGIFYIILVIADSFGLQGWSFVRLLL